MEEPKGGNQEGNPGGNPGVETTGWTPSHVSSVVCVEGRAPAGDHPGVDPGGGHMTGNPGGDHPEVDPRRGTQGGETRRVGSGNPGGNAGW